MIRRKLAEAAHDGVRRGMEWPVRDGLNDRFVFVFKGPRGPIADYLTLADRVRAEDAIDLLFERAYERLEADLLDVSGWRAAGPLLVG